MIFDIKTGFKTFESWFLILRLESRLLQLKSWYRDWNWDCQILSLDVENGIETFEITVLLSKLVSRLKKQGGGIPVIETLARFTAHLNHTTIIHKETRTPAKGTRVLLKGTILWINGISEGKVTFMCEKTTIQCVEHTKYSTWLWILFPPYISSYCPLPSGGNGNIYIFF